MTRVSLLGRAVVQGAYLISSGSAFKPSWSIIGSWERLGHGDVAAGGLM